MNALHRKAFLLVAALATGCNGLSDSATRSARHPADPAPADVPAVVAQDVPAATTDAGMIPAQDVPQGVTPTPVTEIPGHENLPVDNSHKEGPRLMTAETLIRSYLSLFGGLAPLDLQTRLRGTTPSGDVALFDTWVDYLSALGLPDYALDIPRFDQTNPLMLAAFERIGIALCDRAVEGDLRGAAPASRVVFRFDLTPTAPTDAQLDLRIASLHRRFLAYPITMAPDARAVRFRQLYRDTVARAGTRPRFNAVEAGWAAVCYAFVRHPEFHVY
jgi:hypothetical protein